MPASAAPSFLEHFALLDDPRQAGKVLYPLPEILLLLLCATIAGADDFAEIACRATNTSTFCAGSCPISAAFPAMMCCAR
jgi:hypothetical protein